MIDERVLSEMERMVAMSCDRLRKEIRAIIAKCHKEMSMSTDGTISQKTRNALLSELVKLSDELIQQYIESVRNVVSDVTGEDSEDILAYVNISAQKERMDFHMSRLLDVAIGWILVGIRYGKGTDWIYRKSTSTARLTSSEEWRNVMKGSWMIGIKNPINSPGLLLQTMVNTSYQFGEVMRIKKAGAIGYYVRRGSNYPCQACDDNLGYIHPVEEICLPVHPRCCCYIEPVFSDGT